MVVAVAEYMFDAPEQVNPLWLVEILDLLNQHCGVLFHRQDFLQWNENLWRNGQLS